MTLRDPPVSSRFPPDRKTAESLAASLDLNSIGWRTVTVIPITTEEKNRVCLASQVSLACGTARIRTAPQALLALGLLRIAYCFRH